MSKAVDLEAAVRILIDAAHLRADQKAALAVALGDDKKAEAEAKDAKDAEDKAEADAEKKARAEARAEAKK